MNLVVDIGNTLAKVAIFEADSILFNKRLNSSDLKKEITALHARFGFKNAIVSNVGENQKNIFEALKNVKILFLNHKTPIPFQNNYATPKTLGVDRIALVAAAALLYPNQNCLVIDAGTCITYDFLTQNKIYNGGAISNGLKMRYQALHHYTASLPLLEKSIEFNRNGASTNDAMHLGIEQGVLYEIEGFIDDFRNHYANFIIILTGGDAKHLSKSIKSSIFVRPNFLMRGLSKIVAYNLNL